MRNSKPNLPPVEDSPFAAVRQRFEDWRQTRRRRSPIPEDLWGEAVALARAYGMNRTAQALRLNYASLKQRLEAAVPTGSAVPPAKPAFVELVPTISVGLAECTVELERPGEAILRIHLKRASMPDVEALARTFLSAKA